MVRASEIWESTTGGTTWLQVKDTRNPGAWTPKRVGGKGSKRITLSIAEREFNQENIPYENHHLDPFTNGLLVRISPKVGERGKNDLTDAELITLLAKDDDEFAVLLKTISSEVILRRLTALARTHSSMARWEVCQTLVDERYRVGKTSQVVKEIQEDEARNTAADL